MDSSSLKVLRSRLATKSSRKKSPLFHDLLKEKDLSFPRSHGKPAFGNYKSLRIWTFVNPHFEDFQVWPPTIGFGNTLFCGFAHLNLFFQLYASIRINIDVKSCAIQFLSKESPVPRAMMTPQLCRFFTSISHSHANRERSTHLLFPLLLKNGFSFSFRCPMMLKVK